MTSIQLLEFEIQGQRYALPLDDLVEVVRAVAFTNLPDAPRVIHGVIDLRGRIVPVLDLRARFGHPARELDPSEHFVIARAGRRIVAMRVDRALGLATVSEDMIEPLDRAVPRGRWVAGLAKTADGVVIVHDVATFLSETESEALEHALGAQDVPA